MGDFLKGGIDEVECIIANGGDKVEGIRVGSVPLGPEFALGLGKGKSQDGEEGASGDEEVDTGPELWMGKLESEINWGLTNLGIESKIGIKSREIGWDVGTKGAVEVSKEGKRWGNVTVEWGEEE